MHVVEPEQTYRSITNKAERIRVFEVDGYRARVADAVTRRRPRWVSVLLLHRSPLTVTGRPWPDGYVRET